MDDSGVRTVTATRSAKGKRKAATLPSPSSPSTLPGCFFGSPSSMMVDAALRWLAHHYSNFQTCHLQHTGALVVVVAACKGVFRVRGEAAAYPPTTTARDSPLVAGARKPMAEAQIERCLARRQYRAFTSYTPLRSVPLNAASFSSRAKGSDRTLRERCRYIAAIGGYCSCHYHCCHCVCVRSSTANGCSLSRAVPAKSEKHRAKPGVKEESEKS